MPELAPVRAAAASGSTLTMADAIRPDLPALVTEAIKAIELQVPEIGGLLAKAGGRYTESDIAEILETAIARAALGESGIVDRAARMHDAFIKRAFAEGCTLGALHTAFQVGARVIWRHLASAGSRTGIAPDEMYFLAECLFAQLESITAQSTEIFRGLESDPDSTLKESREQLGRLLMSGGEISLPLIPALARKAAWPIPEKVACVAVDGRRRTLRRLLPSLDTDVLVDADRPDPCLLIPSPDLPGRHRMLARGLSAVLHALGPTVDLKEAPLSLRLARDALSLARRGLLPRGDGHIRCDDHLSTLHVAGNDECLPILMRKAQALFADLTPERRNRLSETLLVWLSSRCSLVEVAEQLRVHPQTVRYRMRKLEDLFGERMDDPDWRFEMELALRHWRLQEQRAAIQADRDGAAPPAVRTAPHEAGRSSAREGSRVV